MNDQNHFNLTDRLPYIFILSRRFIDANPCTTFHPFKVSISQPSRADSPNKRATTRIHEARAIHSSALALFNKGTLAGFCAGQRKG